MILTFDPLTRKTHSIAVDFVRYNIFYVVVVDQPQVLLTAEFIPGLKGVVHFKKKKLLLIIYSLPCHPRYPCHSFFSQKRN